MTLITKTQVESDGGQPLFSRCKPQFGQLDPFLKHVLHGASLQGLLETAREMELTHARCLRHVFQPEMIANVTIQKILYSAKSRSAQTVDSPPF